MNTDVQPVANTKTGEVTSFVNRNARFQRGPSLAEVEARKANFEKLKAMDPEQGRKVETGGWSPQADDELFGDFVGIAILTRNPKEAKDFKDIEDMQAKIQVGDPSVEGLPVEYREAYTKDKPQIPFPAAAINTEGGVRFLSMTMAMEKFGSGQIPDGSGVHIKCTHAKAQEMTQLTVTVLREGPAVQDVDTDYTEA